MSHETDETLDAMLKRNPGNADIARLVTEYRKLRDSTDNLLDGIGHLLSLNLIRARDLPKNVRAVQIPKGEQTEGSSGYRVTME